MLAPKQRLLNLLLPALLAGGAIVAVASLAGIAAPPRAATLVGSFDSIDNLAAWDENGQAARLQAGSLPAPPFTIEAQARPVGSEAEWGLWIDTGAALADFIIDHEGYFFTEAGDWQPFIHLRAGLNRLYLHVNENRQATLRLNGEIAWQGELIFTDHAAWGILLRQGMTLEAFEVSLRAG